MISLLPTGYNYFTNNCIMHYVYVKDHQLHSNIDLKLIKEAVCSLTELSSSKAVKVNGWFVLPLREQTHPLSFS